MATIEQNLRTWNDAYAWPEHGDEWSCAWGSASTHWVWGMRPRLEAFIPARTVLEIAPGFGRWTQFLRPLCDRLILVDLSPKCIAACQGRFAAFAGLEYHVNDGRSLEMVPDGSIDLAFSFDSLVHVESDVLTSYLRQLAQKLTPEGVAFLHHSNLGAYLDPASGAFPAEMTNPHWRALSVSAETVREACETIGLCCVSQELLSWGGTDVLEDAITVAARPSSHWARPTLILRNAQFMWDAHRTGQTARLYELDHSARGKSV